MSYSYLLGPGERYCKTGTHKVMPNKPRTSSKGKKYVTKNYCRVNPKRKRRRSVKKTKRASAKKTKRASAKKVKRSSAKKGKLGTKSHPYKTVSAAKKSMKYKKAKPGSKVHIYHMSGRTKRLRRVLKR